MAEVGSTLLQRVSSIGYWPPIYSERRGRVTRGRYSDDEFYDFSDEDEKALTLRAESRTLGGIYNQEGEGGLQNWITQSVMQQLNELHVTSKASRSHIEELNSRLQKMEEDNFIVQQQLQGGFYVPHNFVWGLVGLGTATSVLLGAGH